MSNNRGSKRTAPSDDDDDLNDESTSAERNDSGRRSPTFQIKPGPASWKRSFHTQPNPSRSYLGSSSQKPVAVSSKTASAVDKKTAANSAEATFQRLRNDSKESKIGVDNNRNEFIWLVRRFPHLYNPKDPFFKNVTKKEKSWTAISEIVGMSAEDCRVRWKLLRDRYCRERKKQPQHIDPDFRDLMETELKFLDSVIQHRRTIEFPILSPRRPSIDEEQTLQSTANASSLPAPSVPRDGQDSRASSSKQTRRDQQPRIIMSLKTGKNASTPSPTPRRATNQSTSLNSRPQTKPNGANAGNNSASHDGSVAEEENKEEEEDEEEEDEEREEEDSDDNDEAEVNGVQSRANGRTARRPIGPLNNAISTLSRMKQTQDTDQLFADTLGVIFRQFSPKDKNLILSKFLRYIVKIQRKMK